MEEYPTLDTSKGYLLLWATIADPAPDSALIAGIVPLIIARYLHTTLAVGDGTISLQSISSFVCLSVWTQLLHTRYSVSPGKYLYEIANYTIWRSLRDKKYYFCCYLEDGLQLVSCVRDACLHYDLYKFLLLLISYLLLTKCAVSAIIFLNPPAQSLQAEDIEVKLIWPQRRLYHGESAMEGDRISPLQNYGQPLNQETCFSCVFGDC